MEWTYYLNILLPVIAIFLAYLLSKFINQRTLQIILVGLLIIGIIILSPILFFGLRANNWTYDYFEVPIFLTIVMAGILTFISKKRFLKASIILAIVSLALNYSWNFINSFAVGWAGGKYNSIEFNEKYKNEPILVKGDLQVLEHKQSAEISHYILNRTSLNGFFYKQVGFETRDVSICKISFKIRDTKEIYDFDKCGLILNKVEK